MRFIHALVALLVGQAAVATPITHAGMDLISRSVNPQYDAVSALDPRELEKRSPAKLSIMLSEPLELANLPVAHYSGAQAEILPDARKRNYGDIHAGYVDWWTNVLGSSANDLTYDAVSSLAFDNEEEILQRRDGDPALVSRVLLAGLTGSHSPNTKQDIIANHFADGNTLLHLPIGESSTDKRGKRVPPGSGFKISCTTRSKSRLSYSKQQEMSGFIAAAWAAASETYKMTDFIGFAQDGYNVNFYYRIIPGVRGFGLNYESVDVCGGMGDFLFERA